MAGTCPSQGGEEAIDRQGRGGPSLLGKEPGPQKAGGDQAQVKKDLERGRGPLAAKGTGMV